MSIWDSFRGHQDQVEMFRRAVGRGRVAHAFLLIGPSGVGKRLFARRITQALFCQRRRDEDLDACGECSACQQVEAETHPDLLQIGCPDGKQELPIDLLLGPPDRRGREGLCHDLSLRPMSADRKVAIIDDADCMNEASANALLKTLEEPPAGSILFLITPALEPILSTIRSRCQPIRFAGLATSDVAALIVETGLETDAKVAEAVARMSEGSLTVASQLLDEGVRALRSGLDEALRAGTQDAFAAAQKIIESIEELAKDPPTQRRHARWLIRFAVDHYARQFEEADDAKSDKLVRQIERCLDSQEHLDGAMPLPLCLEGLCLDLARLERG
jgi:DNA polymerase-3 subunit delta'